MHKYQINSAQSIIPMSINFKVKLIDETKTILIGVNYASQQIVFYGDSIPEIDYQDLEQEILSHLKLKEYVKMPEIPDNLFQKQKYKTYFGKEEE